ncbi:helix-turn-helix domain-containing protein [Jeotgalicoccus halotolerans]|uniref:HTH cro/C1-type domain-containing protein n=1 Tax=Jeotgalicoccus halotolerans TaxID=157227 RepID=A0A3E0AVM2_9STAP|nr:helix-turn-helix domain-containing protein [Jeotgalicoccus halotolerans]REG23793.1 hypothetical protein DFR63_1540 [Jeotgalicoccus halotolerans]
MDKEKLNGREMRVLRALRNINQAEAAALIKRTRSSIAHLENGHRKELDEIQSKVILERMNVSSELLKDVRHIIKQGAN